MIVKNCLAEMGLETKHAECIPYQADSYDLNMKLCIGTIPSPLFQECRFSLWSKEHNSNENYSLSSSLFHQPPQKDKTMDPVSKMFVEKFSELKLEGTAEVKLEAKRVGDTLKTTDVATVENHVDQKVSVPDKSSYEHLPVAKISIKEKDEKPLCLSCDIACSDKSKLHQNENITTKSFNPLSQSLVSRSPDRNRRRHCKVPQTYTMGYGKSADKQKTGISDIEIFNFDGSSPSTDSSAKLLHGIGGRFSEINPPMSHVVKNVCRFDQEISLEQIGSCMNYIDQFSPSSVCSASSSARSSSSPSIGYLSPSSTSNIESYSDARNPSPNISDLYLTPPSSVLHSGSLQTSEYFSESSPEYNSSQFNINDDSLVQFPFLDESLMSTDVLSPLSEKNEFDTLSPPSSQGTVNDIAWFLKNGNVDPTIAEIVNRCSKSFDETPDRNCSKCDSTSENDKTTQKLDSVPNPLTSSHTILSAQLPPNTVPSNYNSGTCSVQPTLLLMPVQLQTATVPEQKDRKCQRAIKPYAPPKEEGIDLPKNEERCCVIEDKPKYKSVKDRIHDTITREEKKKFLKSVLEEGTTTDGTMKLHSSVKSGNEKLVYIVIQTARTYFSKTENSNLKTDKLNPRRSISEKIQRFVNEQDELGCTPLYYAAFTDNNLLAAYLLECGADPFIKDYKNGNTPYHVASLRGDSAVKLMELLSFERNATDVTNKKGQTVLMAAVINHGIMYNGVQINGLKLIKHLLCSHHKLSPQDIEGRTVLHIAVMKKDVELLKVLLMFGTDVERAQLIKNKEGNTILHDAALSTNYKLIEAIILHCSRLTEIRNNRGKLPYELANENKQERELLKNKFDEYGYRNL